MSTIVFLNDVRLSHPHLWTPAAPMAGSISGPKYDCNFLMTRESQAFTDMQAAFIKETQASFGANFAAIVGAMERGKKCLRDGNMKLDKSGTVSTGYAGMMYVAAKNKIKPLVLAKQFFKGKPVYLDESGNAFVDGRPVTPAELGFTPKSPYGGCYVNGKVEVYAMNKPGIQGVYATLIAVQFHRDGESFGGGAAPTADGFESGEADAGEAYGDPFAGNASTGAAAPNLFG